MQEFMELLQQYNGAASAIAAFLALLLNAFSVALAAYLYKENKRLREEGSEPDVVVFLRPDERYRTIANIVVANIGKGPAHHIKLTYDAKEADLNQSKIHTKNLEVFKKWRVLPHNEQISLFFGQWPDLLRTPPLPSFNIMVSFASAEGKKFKENFEIDVSHFSGMRTVGSPPDHEMATALKKIADDIHQWSSGFNRLKIETITTQEQQEIYRKQSEEWNNELQVDPKE